MEAQPPPKLHLARRQRQNRHLQRPPGLLLDREHHHVGLLQGDEVVALRDLQDLVDDEEGDLQNLYDPNEVSFPPRSLRSLWPFCEIPLQKMVKEGRC